MPKAYVQIVQAGTRRWRQTRREQQTRRGMPLARNHRLPNNGTGRWQRHAGQVRVLGPAIGMWVERSNGLRHTKRHKAQPTVEVRSPGQASPLWRKSMPGRLEPVHEQLL